MTKMKLKQLLPLAEDKLEKLVVGSREFSSRLLVGTGKYKDFQETQDAIVASGAEVVTVAIRRLNLDNPKEKNILDLEAKKEKTNRFRSENKQKRQRQTRSFKRRGYG